MADDAAAKGKGVFVQSFRFVLCACVVVRSSRHLVYGGARMWHVARRSQVYRAHEQEKHAPKSLEGLRAHQEELSDVVVDHS
jgi:hypothetical protein